MQAVRLTCGTYAEPYLYGYSGGGGCRRVGGSCRSSSGGGGGNFRGSRPGAGRQAQDQGDSQQDRQDFFHFDFLLTYY